jgi:dihydrofolate synthase/folylpolyglutamate synthase
MGVFRDKEYEKIASIMGPMAKAVYTIDLPDRERTLPKEELAQVLRAYCKEDTVIETVESIENAVEMTWKDSEPEDIILAFGSLSYLGEVIKVVDHMKKFT